MTTVTPAVTTTTAIDRLYDCLDELGYRRINSARIFKPDSRPGPAHEREVILFSGGGRLLSVLRIGSGFEAFVPIVDSNSIDETLDAIREYTR